MKVSIKVFYLKSISNYDEYMDLKPSEKSQKNKKFKKKLLKALYVARSQLDKMADDRIDGVSIKKKNTFLNETFFFHTL
jgi:hypothetical protein